MRTRWRAERRRHSSFGLMLDRKASQWSCVGGWIVATAVFVAAVQALGGPTANDAELSIYTSWTLAHGSVACAFPPAAASPYPLVAPLYPLLSGGLSALLHVGHGVAFPSQASFGHGCQSWLSSVSLWGVRSGSLSTTLRFGYVGWVALLIGIVTLLRATGRGRCGWEWLTLVLVACTAPVFMCLQSLFHPQDLLAMGLALGGVACVRRGSWVYAGALLGLAFTSQQFALLLLAPLLVVAPARQRMRYLVAAVAAVAVVAIPLAAMTSGRALRAVLVGSGMGGSQVGSVLWELHVHGAGALALWRLLPVGAATGLASWVVRRLGPASLETVPLLSLVATSFALRLVFEKGLYGYYFMATAVALVVLDVVRRKWRMELVGWLALVILVFDPLPWGVHPFFRTYPMWIWQLLLVPIGVAMAAAPLISYVREHERIAT